MRGLIGAFLFFLIACDAGEDYAGTTERARLRTEAESLASAWLTHAATPSGFQKTVFDADWRELPGSDRVDLTSQARLVYLYAAAFDLSGEPRYLNAMVNAADFMLRYMQGVTEVGWVKRVSSSGLIIDNSIDPYGYSFVVFSLSHAYQVSGDERYRGRAIQTWRSDVWPGLKAAREWPVSAESGLKIAQGNWSQSAYMHLFEALLALHEVTHSVEVWADIVAMAKFLDESLIQSCTCLPEWFLVPGFTPLNGMERSFIWAIKLNGRTYWIALYTKGLIVDINSLPINCLLLLFVMASVREKRGIENGGGCTPLPTFVVRSSTALIGGGHRQNYCGRRCIFLHTMAEENFEMCMQIIMFFLGSISLTYNVAVGVMRVHFLKAKLHPSCGR